MKIPAGWTDNGTALVAPNGNQVVWAFRWHILLQTWAADNWPLEDEHYEQVIDASQPHLGAGVVQRFRSCTLILPQSTNVVQERPATSASAAAHPQAIPAVSWPNFNSAPAASAQASTMMPTTSSSASPATRSTSAVMSQDGGAGSLPAALTSLAARPPMAYTRPGATPAPRAATKATTARAASADVTPAQRLASLEQQLQALLASGGLVAGASGADAALTTDLEQSAIEVAKNPSLARKLFFNRAALSRWLLLLAGALLSNGLSWASTHLLHQALPLHLPF